MTWTRTSINLVYCATERKEPGLDLKVLTQTKPCPAQEKHAVHQEKLHPSDLRHHTGEAQVIPWITLQMFPSASGGVLVNSSDQKSQICLSDTSIGERTRGHKVTPDLTLRRMKQNNLLHVYSKLHFTCALIYKHLFYSCSPWFIRVICRQSALAFQWCKPWLSVSPGFMHWFWHFK